MWSSRVRFPRPVTMRMSRIPEATASSTTYWIVGLSTMGSISLGWALVAGRNRVPSPAAGMTAFATFTGPPRALGVRVYPRPGGWARSVRPGRLDPAAPRRLGPIHGGVGGGHQVRGPITVIRVGGRPDAHGERDRRPAVREEGCLGDDPANLLGHDHRSLGGGLRKDDQELLPPVAGQEVDLAADLGQDPAGQLHQDLV